MLALLLPAGPALAWAPLGHQIVAPLAARQLTPVARARIAALLGGNANAMMVLDSSWGDEIRGQRPETDAWHYVNIEIGSAGYDAARDCPADDCVVAQITRDTRIFSDVRAPPVAKAEALRFLIHFVGDIHQPLHAADRHDKGGNHVKLRWRGKRVSLHQIWDQDVVEALARIPGASRRR